MVRQLGRRQSVCDFGIGSPARVRLRGRQQHEGRSEHRRGKQRMVWGGHHHVPIQPDDKDELRLLLGVMTFGMTADGVGNVYFSATDGSTGSVYILPAAATATAPVAPIQISSTVGSGPSRLMPDATSASPATVPGNIWVTSNANFVSQLSKSTAPGNMNGWITTPFPTLSNSRGVSIDSANNVVVSATNSISELAHSGTTWTPANGFPSLNSQRESQARVRSRWMAARTSGFRTLASPASARSVSLNPLHFPLLRASRRTQTCF